MSTIGSKPYKKVIFDERGELSYFTIFFVLAIHMILVFLLLFVSIKIDSINIRNAVKMELNNMSARIYADTFHSQREANLDSYMKDLRFTPSYEESLRSDFIQGLQKKILLETEKYIIKNIQLSFKEYKDKIEYIFSCEIHFKIYMLGENFPIKREIELVGSHRTKY